MLEVITHIFKQLPPIWPRVIVLALLVLALALPQTRRVLFRRSMGTRRLERAKKLLELRKLEIEVAALRSQHSDLKDSVLDQRISRILVESLSEDEEKAPRLPWIDRLKLASSGALIFLLIGTLAMGVSGRREGVELFTLVLKELLVIVPCALIASAIPAPNRWGPVFYGLLIPILIVAIVVTAGLHE